MDVKTTGHVGINENIMDQTLLRALSHLNKGLTTCAEEGFDFNT